MVNHLRRKSHDEDDIPSWTNTLHPGQPELDADKLSDIELVAEFRKRLAALLDQHSASNSIDGWRDVAINLALTLHPAFRVKKKKKLPVSGRPITPDKWIYKNAFLAKKRQLEKAAAKDRKATRTKEKSPRLARRAAELVHAEFSKKFKGRRVPSVKTIQNYGSQRVEFPREWNDDNSIRLTRAARAAARQLED